MQAGGAERVISHLSKIMSEQGHSVSILMISVDSKTSFYKLDEKVRLIPFLPKGKKIRYFKRVKMLKEFFLKEKPDIVLSFLPHVCVYVYLALKNTNIPFILSERNDPNRYNPLLKYLLKKAFRVANGCVYQTQDSLDWYRKKQKPTDRIIFNPVSIAIPPEGYDYKHRNKNVLYVARIDKQKNYKLLLKSFAFFHQTHPEYILDYFGDGPERSAFESYAKKCGIYEHIVMHGRDSTWQEKQYNAGVFVSTSLYEGMPNSLLEAASLQIPCVATDCPVGGSKELSKIFNNILLVDKNIKPQDFALKMNDAIKMETFFAGIKPQVELNNIASQWLDIIEFSIKNVGDTKKTL